MPSSHKELLSSAAAHFNIKFTLKIQDPHHSFELKIKLVGYGTRKNAHALSLIALKAL